MLMNQESYSALIKTRVPQPLRAAVEIAANREFTTPSAYARKAIANQLRADGFLDQSERAG
jgi:hypothetical protein